MMVKLLMHLLLHLLLLLLLLLLVLFLLKESVFDFAHLLHDLLVECRLLLELGFEVSHATFQLLLHICD